MNRETEALRAMPSIAELLRKHSLSTKKSFGQHFIFDLNLTDKIVRAAGDLTDCTVLEIGPGPGTLTRSLLMAGAGKVIAIEKDERALPLLEEIKNIAGARLEIIHGDALKISEENLASGNVKIISNLPYNISTALLFKWLDKINLFSGMTLMFQKEVADRIAAVPGNKSYGRISILTQWQAAIRAEFDVPPTAFIPPPKIISTVLNITPYPQPLYPAKKENLKKICEVFNQRRKILRGSLKKITPDAEKLLEAAGIDPLRRPETLTIQEFCRLAEALEL